jgi:hypothetical protein
MALAYVLPYSGLRVVAPSTAVTASLVEPVTVAVVAGGAWRVAGGGWRHTAGTQPTAGAICRHPQRHGRQPTIVSSCVARVSTT